MRAVTALRLILGLSAFGVVFSGVLTYRELFGTTALSCPAPGAPGTVLGYPACVYGFFMYVAIAALSYLGLREARRTMGSEGRETSPAHRSAG